jgi:predicted amidohydrolase YtcJ
LTGLLITGCKLGRKYPCSVYIEGGKVARVVEGAGIAVPGGTETVEANGGSLFPGFIDTHCHPFEYGWLKRSVDLKGTTNMTAVRLRLSSAIARARPGEWVTGMGWDQETFPIRKLPSRSEVDDISQANPVALTRVCGHIALLNTRAIETLGLASRTGAEYDRDQSGNLTGIVKENAVTEVFAVIPRSVDRSAADLQSVEAEAGRFGLTAIHCIMSREGYREELAALARLEAAGSLSLNYRVYVPPEAIEFVESEGYGKRFSAGAVRLNGVKIYSDGSLGARTAALREPYTDDPQNSGILRHTDEELASQVEKADALGYQVIIHAIGDRGAEQAIEAISLVAGSKNPRRHRVEHASLLPKDLRAKMVKHSIRASVQPLFITSDTWAVDRLGEERARDLYPLRSMLREGIIASGGSDSPIESLSPVLAMWAAMTRGGLTADESLSFEEAVSLYTTNASKNGFDDRESGVNEGSPADLTLLDSDTEDIHPALLRKVGALATVVGGILTHSFGGS